MLILGQVVRYIIHSIENNVGKIENTDIQHSFHFQQDFQEASFSGLLTHRIV